MVETFGVCDFSRLAVTDWRLRRWRLWFLALMTATRTKEVGKKSNHQNFDRIERYRGRLSSRMERAGFCSLLSRMASPVEEMPRFR